MIHKLFLGLLIVPFFVNCADKGLTAQAKINKGFQHSLEEKEDGFSLVVTAAELKRRQEDQEALAQEALRAAAYTHQNQQQSSKDFIIDFAHAGLFVEGDTLPLECFSHKQTIKKHSVGTSTEDLTEDIGDKIDQELAEFADRLCDRWNSFINWVLEEEKK